MSIQNMCRQWRGHCPLTPVSWGWGGWNREGEIGAFQNGKEKESGGVRQAGGVAVAYAISCLLETSLNLSPFLANATKIVGKCLRSPKGVPRTYIEVNKNYSYLFPICLCSAPPLLRYRTCLKCCIQARGVTSEWAITKLMNSLWSSNKSYGIVPNEWTNETFNSKNKCEKRQITFLTHTPISQLDLNGTNLKLIEYIKYTQKYISDVFLMNFFRSKWQKRK